MYTLKFDFKRSIITRVAHFANIGESCWGEMWGSQIRVVHFLIQNMNVGERCGGSTFTDVGEVPLFVTHVREIYPMWGRDVGEVTFSAPMLGRDAGEVTFLAPMLGRDVGEARKCCAGGTHCFLLLFP